MRRFITLSIMLLTLAAAADIFRGVSAINAGTRSVSQVYAGPRLVWSSAAPAFSPTDIANLSLWLDASDASTIKHASGAVTNWMDKSGLGNHAVAIGADTTRPATGAATLDGKNAIVFDGGDYLATAFIPIYDELTFFCVLLATTEGNLDYFAGAKEGAASFQSYFAVHSASQAITGTGETMSTFSYVWGASHSLLSADYNADTVRVWRNGAEALSAAKTGSAAHSTRGYHIGGYNNRGTAVPAFIGRMGELLVYRRKLSDTDRAKVEAYLKDKWGL